MDVPPQAKTAKPPSTGWTWIDNQVIDRATDIGGTALAVYLVLAKHADDKRECFPRQEKIAETLNTSEDTVQRALKDLRAAGLVSWKRKSRGRGGGCFNFYSLALQNRTGAPLKAVTKPQIPVTKPQMGPLQSRTGAARTRPKNKTHLEQEPSKSPKGDSVTLPDGLDDDQFRKAWSEWEQHKREIKKALTPSTRKRQLAKLSGWGVDRAVRSIEASIEHGWQGLFDPDEKAKRNGKSTRPTGAGQRHPEDAVPDGVF